MVGGAQFVEAFRRYLGRYGWRPEFWFELSLPALREDPRRALRSVRRYLMQTDDSPRRALARSADRRRRTTAKMRRRLRGDPEELARFEVLLKNSRQYVPVREGRALWQLSAAGCLRVPCLTLGRKLSEAGALDNAEDITYLRLSEIDEAAADPDAGDWRRLVADRRTERDRWMEVVPPITIGAPPNELVERIVARMGRFSGIGEEIGADERVLRGSAASAGVVRAPAKVDSLVTRPV